MRAKASNTTIHFPVNTLPHFHGKALPISSATKTFKGFFFCRSLFLIQSAEVKERPPSTEISIESSPRRRYFCGLFLWILLYKVQKKKKKATGLACQRQYYPITMLLEKDPTFLFWDKDSEVLQQVTMAFP